MQVCTSLQTDNHASTPTTQFFTDGCPSCRPTNSVKALKAIALKAIWQGKIVIFFFLGGGFSPPAKKKDA